MGRRCTERMSVFFVWKKDKTMRLVTDCRRSNQWLEAAPSTKLFSSAGMADIGATEEGMMWYSGFDVSNAFFQHSLPQWLRSLFCLPPVAAGDIGLAS